MSGVKLFSVRILIILISTLLSVFQISENASLSLQEQKKYKSFIEGQGLYSTDDDVEILTAHNFKNELYNKNHAWVIEFYNSWCGFCQRFAPSWKALATDIKGWNDLIKVGAIDCADDDNNPLCHEFEIMSYPTLLYFHENYQEGKKNLGSSIQKGQDMQEHKQYLIDHIISQQDEGRASHFPDLHATTLDSVSKIRNSVPQGIKYVFLVIQNNGSYYGPEIMLDFHKVNQIAVKYALNTNFNLLSNIGLSEDNLPAIIVIKEDGSVETLGRSFKSKVEMEEAIKNYLKPKNIELPNTRPNKEIFTGKWLDAEIPNMALIMQERERHALMQKIKQMGDVVFQMDLETTLRYSLKHEVPSTSHVSGEKLDALKAYLNVLVKYFPLGLEGQNMLVEMRDSVFSSDATFKTSEIRNRVIEAEKEDSQVFSSPPNWLGCQGSSKEYRGYPCGVWKMFHYLTVNAAEHNNNSNDSGNPLEVLDAMHGYIKHFFGCADCSQHFQQMALRRNMKNVSSYDSAVLWLWMAHNEVNKRLAGDQTEDPEYPKYQFPLKERCPQCRFNNDSWIFPEVLKYVKHMYSSINIRYIGSDTRILHSGLQGLTPTSGASGLFRTIDTNVRKMEQIYEKALLPSSRMIFKSVDEHSVFLKAYDANPIEIVLGYIKKSTIRAIWRSLPEEYATRLFDNMPQRCQAIIDNHRR